MCKSKYVCKLSTVQAQSTPEWQVRRRGAWAGSKLYLKSQTSTFQIAYSTCKGSAEDVLAFWKALGFEVAYDIVKDGVTGICHSAGFAITAVWSKVRSADVVAASTAPVNGSDRDTCLDAEVTRRD